jgi:hypothetical protein
MGMMTYDIHDDKNQYEKIATIETEASYDVVREVRDIVKADNGNIEDIVEHLNDRGFESERVTSKAVFF